MPRYLVRALPVLVTVALLGGCGKEQAAKSGAIAPAEVKAGPIPCTPKDLNDDPDKYAGKLVRLTGTPKAVEDDGEVMFMEGRPGWKVFAHPGRQVAKDRPVTLIGTVRKQGAPPFMKFEIEGARVAD